MTLSLKNMHRKLQMKDLDFDVQELWADKGRMESRFEFKPASLEQGRDLLASSLGRDGSLASSFGPPVNGLLNHNSLSNYSNQNPQLFPQDQALNGHAFGGNNYPGQQVKPVWRLTGKTHLPLSLRKQDSLSASRSSKQCFIEQDKNACHSSGL